MTGRRPRADRSLIAGEAMAPFREAIKSELTRAAYERRVARFLREVGLHVDAFVGRAKEDPRWVQEFVQRHLLRQKERVLRKEIEASTLGNMKKPLRLLLEMNDVTGINWKKLSRLMPRERRYALDRVPTLPEASET